MVSPCVISGDVTDEKAGSTAVGTTAKPSMSGAPTISRLAPTRRLFFRYEVLDDPHAIAL